MPLHVSVDVKEGLARLHATGLMTPEDIHNGVAELLRNPEFAPGFGLVYDRRTAPATTPTVIVDSLSMLLNRDEFMGCRFAMVHEPNLPADNIVRMLEQKLEGRLEVAAFTSADQADSWAAGM
jgi:hypothetical protein